MGDAQNPTDAKTWGDVLRDLGLMNKADAVASWAYELEPDLLDSAVSAKNSSFSSDGPMVALEALAAKCPPSARSEQSDGKFWQTKNAIFDNPKYQGMMRTSFYVRFAVYGLLLRRMDRIDRKI